MDVVTILGLLVSVGRRVRPVFAWSVRTRCFPRLGALVLHLLELHRVVQLHLGLVALAVPGVLLLLHLLLGCQITGLYLGSQLFLEAFQ